MAAQVGNGVGLEALRAESRLAASPAAGLPASGLLAVYAVLATIVVAPILSVRVPGLGDDQNHLARIHILTTIGTSPALQRFYDTHWHLVPYLGMDLPVALLAQVMPIYTAGRIFVAMCVLVPVAGAAVLRYVAYGRVGIVPAFAFLLSYNFVLSNGFLNYLFSAGLAVILFALWVASCGWPRWRRAALFVPAAPLLYLQHPFSFLAYGILVAGFELSRVVRARSFSWPQAALDLAAAALQVVPVACLVLWLAPAAMLGAGAITVFGSLSSKINSLLNTMRFPGNPVIMALTVLVPLGGVMLLRRDIRLAPALAPALLALAIAACCMPSVLFGAWGADFRLTLVAAIVLVGIAAPAPNLQRRKAIAIMAAAACIVAIRSADAFVMLRRFDNQVSQIAQLVAHLPVGSKLLVVEGPADAGDILSTHRTYRSGRRGRPGCLRAVPVHRCNAGASSCCVSRRRVGGRRGGVARAISRVGKYHAAAWPITGLAIWRADVLAGMANEIRLRPDHPLRRAARTPAAVPPPGAPRRDCRSI